MRHELPGKSENLDKTNAHGRLPVPSLWLDVLQKVKALGFNCISFYTDWAFLPAKPGDYRAEGIFALEPFFEAAKEAGIYLLARPGPYVNAESSGGGFPGWLQRVNGTLRTADKGFLDATDKYAKFPCKWMFTILLTLHDSYIATIGAAIAKAQITNGGPVILYQPENEYTNGCCGEEFPDPDYFQYVINQARNAGIVVPMISNDASPDGHNAPSTGKGAADIYGHDSYPLGFDCANPSVWPEGNLPTSFWTLHEEQSPTTPYSLVEFQAGAYDPWGGPGFAACADLVNHEFERVFYKNNFSFRVAIFNLYMIFGGTNWGNLGHPGGYTSYDYGSVLSETRNITREKYSELKLFGNFVKVSPSYLLADPGNQTTGYTNTSNLTVTPLKAEGLTSYYVVRHTDYSSQASTPYKLRLATSSGNVTVPQLGGELSLNGRDSKVHVADYNVSGTNIVYSTAEVFTWKQFADSKVLILYGGPGEHHELAIASKCEASVIEGSESDINSKHIGSNVVISWDVSSTRRIIQVDDLKIFLLGKTCFYMNTEGYETDIN